MPEFSPGEAKTAIVTMANPTVVAFDYLVELYMGTNLALMASKDFHLEAGEAKDISLPVTMPSVSGTYPVYIGVFSSGVSIGLYKAVEDVVIGPPPVASLQGTVLNHEHEPAANELVAIQKDGLPLKDHRIYDGLQTFTNTSGVFYYSGLPLGHYAIAIYDYPYPLIRYVDLHEGLNIVGPYIKSD